LISRINVESVFAFNALPRYRVFSKIMNHLNLIKSCYAQRFLIDIILILQCEKSAWRWSSKRSFVHGVGVQSEALLALEFKAKFCTWHWSSKRSFVHGIGVQSEAWRWNSKRSFVQQRTPTPTKLRFELQRQQSFALNSNANKASL
jgi:hypothetical protein